MDTQQLIAYGLYPPEEEELTEQERYVQEILKILMIVVGTDFDGTLYDSNGLKQLLVRIIHKIHIYDASRLRSRFIKEDYAQGVHDLTAAQYAKIKKYVYESPASQMGESYAGAVRCLRRLLYLGFRLRVVSNRTKKSGRWAKKWLVIKRLTADFRAVGIGTSKVKDVRGCLFYCDNDADKLALLRGAVPFLLHIVPNAHWEHGLDSGGAHRVFDWDEAYQEIIDTVTLIGLAIAVIALRLMLER